MTYIELVIKIPEHYYEINIKNELPICLSDDNIVAILPKGHGRLVDKNDLSLMTVHIIDGMFVCDAPTIIDADMTECSEVMKE